MDVVARAWWYAGPALILAVPALLISPAAALVLAGIGFGILTFFRDPPRSPPHAGIVAPADGRVSVVRNEDAGLRIGVYMNVLDVHVNRAPVAGKVLDVTHRTGAHRPAFSKDSDRNERVRFELSGDDGIVIVELIAGAFARRITPYVSPGDRVDRGERIGHIAFGSRADVILPRELAPASEVERGARVRAGESVIAKAHGDRVPGRGEPS